MTRLELRNLTRKRLGETTAAFWSDSELNTWIDDACTDIAFRSKCIKTDAYMTPVASTAEYALSQAFTGIITLDEVYFFQSTSSDTTSSTWQKLVSINRTDLDVDYPGWKSAAAGVPTMYYWDREDDLFGLYLKPDSNNNGTNYCRAYYRKTHTDMTSDTDTPDIPEYLQPAAADYVAALGFEQRGYGDKANDAWSKYFSKLKDYQIERHREREDDDIIMRNYRNL